MSSSEQLPLGDIGTDEIQVRSSGSVETMQFMPSLLMNAARTAGMGSEVRNTEVFGTDVDREQRLVHVRITASQEVREKFLSILTTNGFTVSSSAKPQLLVFPTAQEVSDSDLEEAM